jgi:hypothetical protein
MARCEQCEIMYINGVRCHETGCPDAWKDETKNCKWCGSDFKPEAGGQKFCSDSCYLDYYDIEHEYESTDDDENN